MIMAFDSGKICEVNMAMITFDSEKERIQYSVGRVFLINTVLPELLSASTRLKPWPRVMTETALYVSRLV
jgi:hypothetical protein